MTVSPVRNDEVGAALELFCGREGAPHAFQLIARGELDLDYLLVARAGPGVVGVMLLQPLPGASVVVWPPRLASPSDVVADRLVHEAIVRTSEARIWQAFLTDEAMPQVEPLVRAGFRRISRVIQMFGPAREVASGTNVLRPATSNPTLFELTLLRSHEGSLDCPELQGARSDEQVLAGYRDCAPDLADWSFIMADDSPVGAAIVAGNELSFLGIVPEHRGRGHGRAALNALHSRDLSLIVDERNTPAINLYRSAGFEPIGHRTVFLRFATD